MSIQDILTHVYVFVCLLECSLTKILNLTNVNTTWTDVLDCSNNIYWTFSNPYQLRSHNAPNHGIDTCLWGPYNISQTNTLKFY